MAPMMPMDRLMSPEVVNHLFEEPNVRRSGMDLAALNIQRGRDHGLPGVDDFAIASQLHLCILMLQDTMPTEQYVG